MEYVAIGVLVVLAFLALRWLQSPKPRTRRLAITVWAAFGPHESAEDAEDALRRSSKAVFGNDAPTEHQDWIDGHIRNFHDWQAAGRFASAEKRMRRGVALTAHGRPFREACKKVKTDALSEAQEAVSALGQQFPQAREPLQTTIDTERQRLEGEGEKKRD